MSCQTTELQEIVLLESPCQLDAVKVVEAIDRVAQSLVVLFLHQEIVVCLVDSLDVVLLDGDQIRLDKGHVVVIRAGEHADDSRVVDTRGQDGQEVGDQGRLLLQVEAQSLLAT